ncbi:NADH dehydrogenase [ubiquinone] 1 alpha subcomplex subunit 3 isoform X3 [Betta splendens]|uniref:NADH dehydrogenase [ubiquinone] 1 alpha subcomplex subunit 3 n=1 Tax=Betta splendens TaxID=158456 RepID=A0A9W2XCA2_BETSP|nr:NADH dehydrogenase [ubiquinone] 1 alpha subcomplex subunit 3 isoform X3 [Betta splendens]
MCSLFFLKQQENGPSSTPPGSNSASRMWPPNRGGIGAFLKNAWNKEPVIFVSCAIGLVGLALPFISPITKYSGMINSSVPYTYPVPVRDDGNMPDVPAHPREPKGNNLEWLKKL